MKINEVVNIDDNHAENSTKNTLKYVLNTKFVQQNCQPFFKAIGGMQNYLDNPGIRLYHGSNKKTDEPLIFDIPKNRAPRDTPPEINAALVKCFKELGFSATRDNSVFMTSNRNQAAIYGQPYYIMPVGEFGFTYSEKIQDFYSPSNFASMFYDGIFSIEPDDNWQEFFDEYLVGNPNYVPDDDDDFDSRTAYLNLKHGEEDEVFEFFNTYLSYARQLNYYVNENLLKTYIEENYKKDNFYEAIKAGNEIIVNCEKIILIPSFYE